MGGSARRRPLADGLWRGKPAGDFRKETRHGDANGISELPDGA